MEEAKKKYVAFTTFNLTGYELQELLNSHDQQGYELNALNEDYLVMKLVYESVFRKTAE